MAFAFDSSIKHKERSKQSYFFKKSKKERPKMLVTYRASP